MQMNLKQKPHSLFIVFIVILLLVSFLISNTSILTSGSSFDIRMHDTYLVIAISHVLIFLAFFCMFYWTIYKFTTAILFSTILSWLHIIFTLLTFLFIALIVVFNNSLIEKLSNDFSLFSLWKSIYIIVFFVFVIAQLLLFINLAGGIIKRFK